MAMTIAASNDFVEHGTLPFVGRHAELLMLSDFWRSTPIAERLRTFIITGEAGSGKSRLLEAFLPSVTAQRGVAVHVKLYHDATAALATLVLESLRSHSLFRNLINAGGGSPLSMAAQALRHAARLRPLLVVIEDIQLLEAEALEELSRLLEMLADEPIAVLFATRPVDQGARGVIERYLIDEMPLVGLDREEIAEMWERIFGESVEMDVIDNVHAATLGNPLALRSALREVIRHGALYAAGTAREFVPPRGGTFDHALHHRVGLLAEGMVAHLSDAEMKLAMRLATLGEVFSREAANRVLPEADMLLDALQRRGILTLLATPALPVNRLPSSSPLLAFSHSLIHKYLADRAAADMGELLRILAFNPPLYSLLPIQLLARATDKGAGLDTARFRAAIECVKDTIHGALMDNDTRSASAIFENINGLYLRHREKFPAAEQLDLDLLFLNAYFNCAHHRPWSPESQARAREYLDRTADLSLDPCVTWRLRALQHWLNTQGKADVVELDFVLAEEERLLAHAPEQMRTERYVQFLENLASFSTAFGDSSHFRAIRQRLDAMWATPGVPDDIRQRAWRKVSPLMLREFSTADELADRMALARRLAAEATTEDMLLLNELFRFVETTGDMERLMLEVRRWRARLMHEGQYLYAQHFRTTVWRAEMFLGGDFGTTEEMIEDNLAITSSPVPAYFKRGIGRSLVTTGMLCGKFDWALEMIDRFPECREALWIEHRAMLALHDDDELRAIAAEDAGTPLAELIGMLIGDAALDPDAAARCVEATAARPLLRIMDLARHSAVLRVVAAIDERYPDRDRSRHVAVHAQQALTAVLEWAAQRKLPPILGMLLDCHGELLPARARAHWKGELAAIADERGALLATDRARPPVSVTMIGTITIARRNAEPHRLRGERMRVLLALLVANTILTRPVVNGEFAAIATGIEDDPDAARLSLTHMVYRLRETIGTQAVITAAAQSGVAGASNTPQLNPALVDVDLVNAWRAIERAREALAEGFLVKAARSLSDAIEAVSGEIIFPTLYDSFFDALRTDFEARLHGLLLAVADRLIVEGDAEGAEGLLAQGFAMMPDDEEIGERLQDALARLGRHAESERIRARGERSRKG